LSPEKRLWLEVCPQSRKLPLAFRAWLYGPADRDRSCRTVATIATIDAGPRHAIVPTTCPTPTAGNTTPTIFHTPTRRSWPASGRLNVQPLDAGLAGAI